MRARRIAVIEAPRGTQEVTWAPRGASADREQALVHRKKGDTAYSLGQFEEAIGHFERAFLAHPAPAYRFHIARCHRQLKNCERAAGRGVESCGQKANVRSLLTGRGPAK